MTQPVAKRGDRVVGVDTHIVLVSSPVGPVPTSMPLPFNGVLAEALSDTVFIDGAAVAIVGSVADNAPPHIPVGGTFQTPPSNQGTISSGSATVFVDGKALARATDSATCCNDPNDQDTGMVVATGTAYSS